MARKERWHAAFKSLHGHNYTISIMQDGYTEDYSQELLLGAEPFVTEEDNDDDIFKPVRKQSGYLSVVCSPEEAAELLPDTNSQNYVELKRDGVVEWVGFMKNESYNQDPFDELHAYQFPLICPLTLLENVEISSTLQNNGGIFSIGYILKMIIDLCGVDFNSVIVSKDVDGIKQMDAVVSFWNWLESNNEYDYSKAISEDNPLYNCKVKIDELLEQICEFFGWTCRIVGKDIFFDVIDKNITAKASIPYNTLGADSRTWQNSDAKPTLELDELTYISKDNKESFVQGVSRINIECDVNKYEDMLLKLPNDDIKLTFGDLVDVTTYNKGTTSHPEYTYEYNVRLVTRLTHAHQYNQNEDFKFRQCRWQNYRVGANLLSDLSLIQISSTQLERFNPHLAMYLATTASDIYRGVNMSMVSHEDFILPEGYICINGDADCYKLKFVQHETAFSIPAEIKWGDNQISNYVAFDNKGKIASNRSIQEQMSNPSIPSGQWINVNSANHGKLSIKFYPVVTTDATVPPYIIIGNLNISFGNKVALNNSKDKNEYKRKTGNSCKESKDLKLAMCTSNGNVAGRALIVNSNYQYITSFNYNGTNKRPEVQLLDRMAQQLASRSRQLIIDVLDDVETTQYPVVENFSDSMAVLSVSRNYRDDKITLQLQQLH